MDQWKSLDCYYVYLKLKCEVREVSGIDPNFTSASSSRRWPQRESELANGPDGEWVSARVEEPEALQRHEGADFLIRSLSSSHHHAVPLPLGGDPWRLSLCDQEPI